MGIVFYGHRLLWASSFMGIVANILFWNRVVLWRFPFHKVKRAIEGGFGDLFKCVALSQM
jgi:predicted membrane protein